MAIRPAFQFYPADWRNNAKLRRCTVSARGAWIDVMCMLHDSDEYGVLRWPLADVAQAAGHPVKLLQELVTKGVLKGADKNQAPYTFTPRHAGKDGDPVTLIPGSDGPCWYCSRFVKDEYIRQRRGANARFGPDNPPPKTTPKSPPKVPIGDNEGYGASSSSSEEQELTVPKGTDAVASPAEAQPPADPIWGTGLAFLIRKGIPNKSARSLLGKIKQACGDIRAGALLAEAEAEDITDPAPWLMTAAANTSTPRTTGGSNANPVRLSAAERVLAHAREGERADAERGAFSLDSDPYVVGEDG